MANKTIKQIASTQTSVKETDWFEIQEDSSEVSKKVQASAFGVPVGTIIMYAKSTAPTNYLICDGAAVSRTTYATLFAVIGTTYGVGDNSTTFNLPNYQAVVPKGVGNQTINTRIKSGPAFATVEEDRMQGFKVVIRTDSAQQIMVSPGSSTSGFGVTATSSGYINSLITSIDSDGTNGTPRTGATVRENSIGTNFCIKYQ